MLDEVLQIQSDLPRIAITMGDPAGIGPEICAKALIDATILEICRPIIIGSRRILDETARQLNLEINFNGENADGKTITVIEPRDTDASFRIGVDTAESGRASARYIETAVDLWRENKIDAISTAPISKKALSLAGYDFPGHTEFFAHLTNTRKVVMSFFAGNLRVVLLSTHISLRNAIEKVTSENLTELVIFSSHELQRLLRRKPRIAVAGLNPHASEGGLFGDEEANAITPAIVKCRQNHEIDVSGPYSPDTVFLRAHRGEFDAVIALYHDQATVPVKSLSFGSAVNVTLGLPLIRTSVDHGTAFDIAGKGVADAGSMTAAIKLAAQLVQNIKDETLGQSC
jgi:4-phospho-D-threonate 3-dehydrogenase / 4-phospho-D-erythronate 3-dehydrogenase